jgi:hypothetical protein
MEESRVREIRSAVERFRKAIEQSDLSGDEYYLGTFPRVCCKPASLLLGKYLADKLDCRPVEFVSAQGWDQNGKLSRSHFWLEHGGLIIDITADQYPEIEQPVIVTTDHTWHNQFTTQKRIPYSEIMDSNTLTQKVPTTYQHILRTLNSIAD